MMANKDSISDPRIVSVKDFRIDADYTAWFSEIKRRYLTAQIKAPVRPYLSAPGVF